MKQRFAPAARAAMIRPSISWCGFFCISSRSLNAPGSDSSALQQRYLRISPRGRNEAFFPIAEPGPPLPPRPLQLFQPFVGLQVPVGALHRPVAAEALVHVDPRQLGLVDVAEQQAG